MRDHWKSVCKTGNEARCSFLRHIFIVDLVDFLSPVHCMIKIALQFFGVLW